MKKAEELKKISESYKGPQMEISDWIYYIYIITKAKYIAKTTGKRTLEFGEPSISFSYALSQKLKEEGFEVYQKYYASKKYIKSISW